MSGFSISIKKYSGRPVQSGILQLTPVSQAVILRTPGQASGLVWNRPVAIRVQAPGKETQVLPIYDRTRLAQLLILGAGLLGSALIWSIYRNRAHTDNLS
jgi:hypothetical protein